MRIFYALAATPAAYLDVMRALKEAGLLDFVQVLLGHSLAERERTRLQAADGGLPPGIDAISGGRFIPDDLLSRCLGDFGDRPDLVVCSGPTPVWTAEARLVRSRLRGRCRLLITGDAASAATHRRQVLRLFPLALVRRCVEPEALLVSAHGARASAARPMPSAAPRARARQQQIAIVLIEHMGDIVACEPVARHVRAQHPDARITWVVKEQYRELVEHHPCVDDVLTVDCITEWNLLSASGLFDVVVNLHINGRNCPHCGCFPVARWETRHDVTLDDYYDHGSLLPVFSSCAGLPPLTDGPKVHVPAEVRERVDTMNLPSEFIVFHCTSNEDSRDWGDDKWRELVALVKRAWNGAIVEVGSQPCAAALAPGDVVNLCGRLSLLECAEVIRRARLFVGVDSGPAHFANAVGTFGVVLLGDYKGFHRYVPYTGDFGSGRNAELVYPRTGPARLIPAARVAAIVRRRLRAPTLPPPEPVRPPALPSPSPDIGSRSAPTVVAFYLPQFHPIPENDAWWGRGFTEWTNVLQGKPLFPGHYQPHLPGELGCYDLRLDGVMARQAEMARRAGLGGFCFWHYWFEGRLLLERPLQRFLEAGPDFPFCLAWANESWSRSWDGHEQETLLPQTYGGAADDRRHFEWLLPFFADRRHLKVDGRPLFLVYRPFHKRDMQRTLDRWHTMAEKAGVPRPYFVSVSTHFDGQGAGRSAALGFDAEVMFQPNSASARDRIFSGMRQKRLLYPWLYEPESRALDDQGTVVCEYDEAWPLMAEANAANREAWPCLVPSWDNAARRPRRGAFVLDRATPLAYGRWLEVELTRAMEKRDGPRILFVNAWNEWGEGCHLEPDRRFGSEYLETTRRVLERGGKGRTGSAQLRRHGEERARYQLLMRRLVRCLHHGNVPADVSVRPHTSPQELVAAIVAGLSDAARGGDLAAGTERILATAVRELLGAYDKVPLLTHLYNTASLLLADGKREESRILYSFVAQASATSAHNLCGKCHFKLAQLSTDRRDGMAHLTRCLKLYPEHAAARQQLRGLRRAGQ